MPDVWTSNPKMLRTTLKEAGILCGHPSRVLHPRDPEWTCIVDSKGMLRDIYIHPASDFYQSTYLLSSLVIIAVLSLFVGLLWGKRFRSK